MWISREVLFSREKYVSWEGPLIKLDRHLDDFLTQSQFDETTTYVYIFSTFTLPLSRVEASWSNSTPTDQNGASIGSKSLQTSFSVINISAMLAQTACTTKRFTGSRIEPKGRRLQGESEVK